MYTRSFMRSTFLALILGTTIAIDQQLFAHGVGDSGDAVALPLQVRQANGGSYPVVGVQNAGVAPRLEIREMQKYPDMFNIFLLGLRRFQDTPQEEKNSYYDICAIHGRPYKPWDDVGPGPNITSPGYCTHVSNLLLPWHRPYLALYEQILFQHVVDVVNEFPAGPQRQRYARAALHVRMPFWDWAVPPENNSSCWPDVVQQRRIEVTMPNGTAEIDNPLFSYKFHPVSPKDMFFNPFASWDHTIRYPNEWVSNAHSQNNLIGPDLDNSRNTRANRLYNLFVFYTNFTQFSNEAWIEDDDENADSLEALHDEIHGTTGNRGHMTYLDFSAYDPVFWMHHCMLDRAFAIWQKLHPNSYVEPMAAVSQTYTIAIGDIKDANSPLEPFSRDRRGTKWTSATVRSTEQFGYNYPETQTNDVAQIKSAVNRLYGSGFTGGGPTGAKKRNLHHDHQALHGHKRDAMRAATAAEAKAASGFFVDGLQHHYTANVISNKHALNGSYAIYLFMGDFDEANPCTWPTAQNLTGIHGTFSGLHEDSNIKRPSVKTSGTVPLTDALLSKVKSGELASMDEDVVADYLEQNLHWRAAQFDDNPVPVGAISDLSVVVGSYMVKPAASDDEFPQRSDWSRLTRITQGKPGGC